MRRKIALAVLIVLGIAVAMGATTDRRLTGDYFNASYIGATNNIVYFMSKSANGETRTAADRKMARWWSFSASSDVTVRIWSPALPAWNGDFTDTTTATSTNWIAIALRPGQTWNSEGLPIYAWCSRTGTTSSLMVIARD